MVLGETVDEWRKNVDQRVEAGMAFGKARGFVKAGNLVIVVTGDQQGSGFTNTITLL